MPGFIKIRRTPVNASALRCYPWLSRSQHVCMMKPSKDPLEGGRMAHPINTLELALRLRRDAEATCMPEYADLMRRAAEDLETFSLLADSTLDQHERRAG